MHRTLMAVLMVVGAGLSAPAAPAGAAVSESGEHAARSADAEAAIRKVLEGYAAAIARSDIAGMEAFVDTSDAFSVFEGRHANRGWSDYRDNHLAPEFASSEFRILDYAIDEIRVGVGDPFAYATFRYRLSAEVKGERREREGLATVVLVRTPTGWKIRHEQS